MSTTLRTSTEFPDFLPLTRFSTQRYLQMIQSGVLGPDDKVELIGGVICDMSPAGIPHNEFLINIVDLFAPLLKEFRFAVQATLPVREGQVYDPDFMLLRRNAGGSKRDYPRPEDVMLLIEAAESSLQRDQEVKLPVYAVAGIQEYWIVDLVREEIIVHRDPEGETYRSVKTLRKGDQLSLLAAPGFPLTVQQTFE